MAVLVVVVGGSFCRVGVWYATFLFLAVPVSSGVVVVRCVRVECVVGFVVASVAVVGCLRALAVGGVLSRGLWVVGVVVVVGV